ncbi:u1 small nuclear ribonucleoprotein 70 kda, putative [Ichthyophthirius multifiliis]|uniref:U1 small nuclear ribonucleoprotein 70 kDa, putative n=1 Tax=Ichthyophthirius multifiliis TaxID=5932 RepID=G0R052_ICHMU|nr:u1 small nuclear ribonucleoprotein 70 kda, putative [Ichthyophthirius multifiliis]EGR29151.1 u1 small nuclear ribonucleoprotein 70 kda, putative [Ichthyophthirius multifiliis]|eukprot:XP_004030387.1 u1 small nuclear ribonucleoprotein 70 kda, putative [Ichthyophthirius multifiliis]
MSTQFPPPPQMTQMPQISQIPQMHSMPPQLSQLSQMPPPQMGQIPPHQIQQIPGMPPPMNFPPGFPTPGQPPVGMGGPLGMTMPPPMMQINSSQFLNPQIQMLRPQKVFFPPDIQIYFKERNIGFVKGKPKLKCRNLDPLSSNGLLDYMKSKFERGPPPPLAKVETPREKIKREKQEKRQKQKQLIKQNLMEWNPFEDSKITSDPYKTLVLNNISYNANEQKIKEHFKMYGPIKSCRIIRNLNQKHRGYGIIEFERTADFIQAYKNAHEKKIDGRRIGVDIERGRTILRFRPMRLGGGLGITRKGKSPDNDYKRSLSQIQSRSRSRDSYDDSVREKKIDKHKKKRYSKTKSKSRSRSKDYYDGNKDRKIKKEKKEKKEKKQKKNNDSAPQGGNKYEEEGEIEVVEDEEEWGGHDKKRRSRKEKKEKRSESTKKQKKIFEIYNILKPARGLEPLTTRLRVLRSTD